MLHGSTRFRNEIIALLLRTLKCRVCRLLRSSPLCATRRLTMSLLLGNDMLPKTKVEILAPVPRRRDAAALDAFHEDRIGEDLAEFADASGILERCVRRASVRFRKAGERAIL